MLATKGNQTSLTMIHGARPKQVCLGATAKRKCSGSLLWSCPQVGRCAMWALSADCQYQMAVQPAMVVVGPDGTTYNHFIACINQSTTAAIAIAADRLLSHKSSVARSRGQSPKALAVILTIKPGWIAKQSIQLDYVYYCLLFIIHYFCLYSSLDTACVIFWCCELVLSWQGLC